jgi:3'-phosphoadenosine 5'-phosphosulfate sulfotransferase (PAPS reductase)/FAD synthetase
MEIWELKQKQSLPLEAKVKLSLDRIRKWYEYWDGNVYVAFSGGKDSTILLHLVRNLYPKVPAVFVNTGLEYPEIVKFVKTIDNVTWLKPKRNFKEVIEKYGYPVVSKEVAKQIHEIRNTKSNKLRDKRLYGIGKKTGRLSDKWKFLIDAPFKISDYCCDVMKKRPFKIYEKGTGNKPIIGMMASDSRGRLRVYIKNGGCNAFNTTRPMSNPLMVWLEKDIWEYIKKYSIPYSSIYDMGYRRTGCMFCMFGVHLEKKPNRFQLMEHTHPKLYSYCMNKLGCKEILDYIGVARKIPESLF